MKKLLTIFVGIIIGIINLIPFSFAQIEDPDKYEAIYDPYYMYYYAYPDENNYIYDPNEPRIDIYAEDPVVTTPTNPTVDPNDPYYDPNNPLVTPDPVEDPTYTANTTTTYPPEEPIVDPPTEPIYDPEITIPPIDYTDPEPYLPVDPDIYNPIDPFQPDYPETDVPPTDSGNNGTTDSRDAADPYIPPVYSDSTRFIPSTTDEREIPEDQPDDPEEELECPETTPAAECPSPKAVAQTIIPQISANQLKILFVTLLGALVGSILWILSRIYSNKAQTNRDQLRLDRKVNLSKQEIRLTELEKSYNNVADSTANLTQSIENGQNLTPVQLEEYKKSWIYLCD